MQCLPSTNRNNKGYFQGEALSRIRFKITFEEHYKMVLIKTNRTTGLLRSLQNLLLREALTSIN